MIRKCVYYFFLPLILLLALYFLFWPVPIDPVAWHASKAPPLTGIFASNSYLTQVELLANGAGHGPEDVAIDSQGRIYGGMEDGRIMRFKADGSQGEVFADSKGRPVGLHFDAEENLVVADAYKGLLSISPAGRITVLSTEANGLAFKLTDDVDIAKDGTIYFSDASHKFNLKNYKLDGMEHRPNGRLLAYDPATKETRLILDKIYFANGVAVSPDQSFVLVNETWKYRILRYWLTGPQKGQTDIFRDNLPGIPDGISSNGRDGFWLALAAPRDEAIDDLLTKPFLRKIIVRLPKAFLPKPKPYGFVLGLDMQGRVIHNLHEPTGRSR